MRGPQFTAFLTTFGGNNTLLCIIIVLTCIFNSINAFAQSRLITSPIYEKAAQPLRSAPIKEYDFDRASVRDVLRLEMKYCLYGNDINSSKKAFSRLKTLSTLRFNYYPNQTKPVEISEQDGVALGCETHVDSGIFTVLYQDKKGGLQVQNRKTKKWHDVPFNKNALVVNTGRALEYLTKGKFKATNHRVLWNRSKRMSIPFFFEPSYDFKMSHSFFKDKKLRNNGQIYENFLNKSLKKFIEYQR